MKIHGFILKITAVLRNLIFRREIIVSSSVKTTQEKVTY